MDTKILKTLPLSLSGVSVGIMLAAADYHVDWLTVLLLIVMAVILHCFSLTAKSEDEKERKSSNVFLALIIASGVGMIYSSFGTVLFMMETLLMLVFGYMIIRAVRHTDFVSRGKGMAYVFVLFGLSAVYGSYYICSHAFGSWPLLFPALSMGFMAIAAKVDDDKVLFRNLMMLAGWAAMIVFSCLRMYDPWHFLFVLSLPLFFIKRHVAVAVFAFAILSGGGFLIYLL